jgi:hypothetical protein
VVDEANWQQECSRFEDALPRGEACILDGQTHEIEPSVLGPALEAFLAD